MRTFIVYHGRDHIDGVDFGVFSAGRETESWDPHGGGGHALAWLEWGGALRTAGLAAGPGPLVVGRRTRGVGPGATVVGGRAGEDGGDARDRIGRRDRLHLQHGRIGAVAL